MPSFNDEDIGSRADSAQVDIPEQFQVFLENGTYLIRFHRGLLASDFAFDSSKINELLQVSSNVTVKLQEVTISPDGEDAYVKIQVISGIAWVPLVIYFLVASAIFVLFNWTVTNIDQLVRDGTETETTTETYTDPDGTTHTRVSSSKKPPKINPLTSLASLLPLVIVLSLGYLFFITPFGKRLLK